VASIAAIPATQRPSCFVMRFPRAAKIPGRNVGLGRHHKHGYRK
jgi:hypothetical protein